MNAFTPGNGCEVSASRHYSNHHEGCCDAQPPNHQAHRRGFFALVFVCAAAACVALVTGALKGVGDMMAAFPDLSALWLAASWDKFFAALGRVSLLLFLLMLVVFVLRRRRRRKMRRVLPNK